MQKQELLNRTAPHGRKAGEAAMLAQSGEKERKGEEGGRAASTTQSGERLGSGRRWGSGIKGLPLDTRLPPDTFGLAPSALLKLGLSP
jgi:hypothetical protein